MRVWVPLRNEFTIGMAVQVHDRKPKFGTKPVQKILDEEPIMSQTMIQLTEWIHRFYYCSWGEAIQASLPVGLNFSSEKKLRVKPGFKEDLNDEEQEQLRDIEEGEYTLKQAQKRWREGSGKRFLNKAIKKGWIQVWEYPRQKVDYKKSKTLETGWIG